MKLYKFGAGKPAHKEMKFPIKYTIDPDRRPGIKHVGQVKKITIGLLDRLAFCATYKDERNVVVNVIFPDFESADDRMQEMGYNRKQTIKK